MKPIRRPIPVAFMRGGPLGGATSYVTGPVSATDNALVRFDGATGQILQNSVVIVSDTGAITGVTTLAAGTSVTTPLVTNAGALNVRTTGANALTLGTNSVTRVTINASAAEVGIGRTPTLNLDVQGQFGVSESGVAYPTVLNGGFAGRYYAIHQAGDWGFVIGRAVNDTLPANLTFYKTRSATGTRTVVANGDYLGRITFQGVSQTGGTVTIGAAILAQVNGTVSNGVMPTDLLFVTVATGDATAANAKWMMQGAGHWTPYTGNTNSFDIGNIGLSPRTVYAGTSMVAPLFVGDLQGVADEALLADVALVADSLSIDLPFSSFVQATAASRLVGRGSAAGAGDFQEITLGAGLSLSGTVLSATGTGDVVGPGSATDNAVALFDGTTGKLIKNSLMTVNDGDLTLTQAAGGTFTVSVSDVFGAFIDATGSAATAGIYTNSRWIGNGANEGFAGEALRAYADANIAGSWNAARITATSINSSGTVTSLIGLYAEALVTVGGGTTTLARAIYAELSRSGGTLTTGVAIDIAAISSTMTTAYGIRIGNITGGGTNYAIDTGTGLVRFGDVLNVNTASGIQVQGNKVLGARGAAVADAAGGLVIDAECRTQVAELTARFRVTGGHGSIAD